LVGVRGFELPAPASRIQILDVNRHAKMTHVEGLQFNLNGELIAAGGNIVRYNPDTGAVLGSFDAVPDNDSIPVPVTVNNAGQIFVADFQNGAGSASADIFRFSADGSSFITVNDPALFGPFGMAIAGADLPGAPPVPIPAAFWLFGSALGLLGWMRRKAV